MIRRTIGAATSDPWPPSSTTATATYRGRSAGANAANHEWGCWFGVYEVPVLPATGTGNPLKA